MAAWFLVLSLFCCFWTEEARVIELDDSFSEKRGEYPWLVKFYAPWCGHCKKLEPVYEEVAAELKRTMPSVFVGKVDATRFSIVTTQFDIRGYPTLKFIQGDKSVTHRGDRTKDNIVEFVKRAMGPAVRWVKSVGKYSEAMQQHIDQVMFFYVGQDTDEGELLTNYNQIAEKHSLQAYFYAGDKAVLPETIKPDRFPTVLVFKDSAMYEYQPVEDGAVGESLEQFIVSERYTAMATVTGPSLNEMTDLNKKLVIVVTESLTERLSKASQRMRDLARSMAVQHRDKYFQHYQFVWMPDVDTATSILMGHLDLPFLFVFDPSTQLYYVSNVTREQEITETSLDKFLQDIVDGAIDAYGGTGLGQRLKRIGFELFMTIYEVYRASAWLALIMFGIPTAVVSFMCYALCCMPTADEGNMADEFRDDSDEELPEYTPGVEHHDRGAIGDQPYNGDEVDFDEDEDSAGISQVKDQESSHAKVD